MVEAMIAIAIFALLASSIISLSIGALNPWLGIGSDPQADALADEGLEAARSIQLRAWNELDLQVSGLTRTNNQWALLGEGTTETIGAYTRQLTLSPVCRDTNNQIAPCPALKTDPHLILIKATISWQTPAGLTKTISKKLYLANWASRFWQQDDWSGGSGQAVWLDKSKYDSGQNIDTATAGQVRLARQAPRCQGYTWTFDNPADYNYDPQKIEVVNGVARLKQERQYTLTQPPINSLNFVNATLNDSPSVVKVSDNVSISGIPGLVDVYAMTYRVNNNCELITMAISDDGLIRNIRLDSFLYETNNCDHSNIFRVNNNVFGLAHIQGGSRTAYLRTLGIDNNGTISKAFIDSYAFAPDQTSFPFVAKTFNKIYAIAYNRANVGQIATVKINDSGIIVHTLVGQRSLVSNAQYPTVSQWLETPTNAVLAVNYSVPAENRNYLKTFTIDLRGVFSPVGSEYSVLGANAAYRTSFFKLQGMTGAFSFIDGSGAATLQTINIQDNGAINQAPIDSFVVANNVRQARLSLVPGQPGNLLLMDYDAGSFAYISLLSVNFASGKINNQVLDTYTFGSRSSYHTVFSLDATHTAVAYRQPNAWGMLSTLGVLEGPLAYVKNATISPKNLYTQAVVDSWISFKEKATVNTGSVNYQLQTSPGNSWRYWTDLAWATTTTDLPTHPATLVNDKLPLLETDSRSLGFKAVLQSNGTQGVELDEVAIDCRNLQFEVGTLSTNQNWQVVNLFNNYVEPVVVASAYEQNNTLPISVRLNNVIGNSFAVRLHNPSDANLSPDPITYFVVEGGLWRLGNLKIEAGRRDTAQTGSYAGWPFESVNFRGGANFFAAAPIVLHQVMTNNDPKWITTYATNLTSLNNPPDTTGMRLGLNAAETATSHQSETIGWVAVESGDNGQIGGINWETNRTNNNIRGHDDGCYSFSYRNTYGNVPLTLTAQQTMNGSNEGSWAVMCNHTNRRAYVQVDEDQVQDAERSHVAETLGLLTFAQPLNYHSSGGLTYSTLGALVSSAFNLGAPGKIQVIEWSSSLPTTATAIKLQVRAAPDAGGLPGVWSSWYGAGGPNTYFTASDGGLISRDLNNNQWVQYRAELSSDGSDTPVLTKVKVNYKP